MSGDGGKEIRSARRPATRRKGPCGDDGGYALLRLFDGEVLRWAAGVEDEQAHARPSLGDDPLHLAAHAEEFPGNIDGGLNEVGEVRFGTETVRERDVPDPPQHVPRVAAERDRCAVKRVVENAGV